MIFDKTKKCRCRINHTDFLETRIPKTITLPRGTGAKGLKQLHSVNVKAYTSKAGWKQLVRVHSRVIYTFTRTKRAHAHF